MILSSPPEDRPLWAIGLIQAPRRLGQGPWANAHVLFRSLSQTALCAEDDLNVSIQERSVILSKLAV